MPLIADDYSPGFLARNRHVNTAFASKGRKAPAVSYERERYELSDGDFVDLDWSRNGSRRLVLVLHGLGGNSSRAYVRGMVSLFKREGWDAIGYNLRGSSGEMNRLSSTYHSGRTDDLREVANAIRASGKYDRLAVVGFSLSGNIVLKCAGEDGVDSPFDAIVAVSAPVDLVSSALTLSKSRYYTGYLLRKLKPYILEKHAMFPDIIDVRGLAGVNSFDEYDSRYTAPLNGFPSALDYWQRCSSLPGLGTIVKPSLLINAADDPILGGECFPRDFAKKSDTFHLCVTRFGGHVGFVTQSADGVYWHERKALDFIERNS